MSLVPSVAELEDLRALSSCAVANAIEILGVRLRNEGFTDGSIRRVTDNTAPAVGFAATLKIRCSSPPTDSPSYIERTQWWDYVMSIPEPRFLVIEDVDPAPGTGALVGEVHAHILKALGCRAVLTNGVVRDVPEVARLGVSLFANRLSVSHAYSHIIEAGCPVKVGGLSLEPGDLLHGDAHGVLCVPPDRVTEIIRLAAVLEERERELFRLCEAPDFSVERLREAIRSMRVSPE
jgi:4-hydroxy-4-methyl-2-oxoglutarate aldolase